MSGPGGTFSLTEADDHFPGVGDDNSGNENIAALGGNDTVLGGDGDDVIDGGIGDDELFGDDGTDFLVGQDGNDRLEGGEGNDTLWDIQGAFTFMDAGTGRDNIQIGSGFQTGSVINGGDGFDTLQTAGGATSLDLIDVSGIEQLETFGARVTATAGQFEAFRVIQSSGEDPGSPVNLALPGIGKLPTLLDLATELNANGGRSATLEGSKGNDTLLTGNGDDTINGWTGNDNLNGNDGADTLIGGKGNDVLAGGKGVDTLIGGLGADTFVLSPAKANRDFIDDFAPADDILQVSAAAFGGGLSIGSLDSSQFVSNLTGLAGDPDDRFIYNASNGKLFFDVNGSAAGGSRVIATFDGLPALAAGHFDIVA